MDTVIIDGKKYKLVPEEKSIMDDYKVQPTQEPVKTDEPEEIGVSGFPVAKPKISDYRERYKQRKIRLDEIMARQPILTQAPRQDTMLDGYTFRGEKLFFGEGLSQEV